MLRHLVPQHGSMHSIIQDLGYLEGRLYGVIGGI